MNYLNNLYSHNRLRDYSSLFSRNCVIKWMKGDLSSIDYKIERYDQSWILSRERTYLDYLKYIYGILEKHYNNEYIVKNSFINDWLIKELGEKNSQVFSEFRLGKAIADMAMFNGKSKVFEIKTAMDSDKRLDLQLEQYRKAFNEIYLIIPKSKIYLYKSKNRGAGIITYNYKENFKLERQANNETQIDPEILMQIFHTQEYKEVVKDFYGYLPMMTSFDQFNICCKLIENIPNKDLNKLFIKQMKKRGNAISFSKFHKELNQISLALNLNDTKRKALISQLKSPIHI